MPEFIARLDDVCVNFGERVVLRNCSLDIVEGAINCIIGSGVNWRPHTKGQKIPAIAYKQLAAGAIGVTCAAADTRAV